ncbi:hypothetical protein [Ralstonia solanacearum]|uniref:hypothetical protein n=1 Tax=Ralstonia solanacearum TaxID=305 RepID=UPI0012D33738|nr:hypothetical protein [Ralstonia solanacearum]
MLQPLPYRFSTGFRVSGCRHARRLRLQHMFFSVTFNRVRDCLLHRGDGHERIDVRNPIRIPHSAFRIPHSALSLHWNQPCFIAPGTIPPPASPVSKLTVPAVPLPHAHPPHRP